MFNEIFRGLVLGLLQGITEFFPVSSSGHLILVPRLFGWDDQGLAFDTVLHLGTLTALVWVFWKDIVDSLKGTFVQRDKASARLVLMVILAAIPGVVFGGLFGRAIESFTRGPLFVALGLFFWGFVLFAADRYAQSRKHGIRELSDMRWIQVIVVGFAQAIALFPGTSRSGITISAGLFGGLQRELAVRFSFLVSIPTVAAAGAYGAYQLAQTGTTSFGMTELIVGFVTAAASGVWAIRFLLSYVSKKNFNVFVLYRIVLAVVVLAIVR
ncbi:undecaprenyl-diphosphatase UppP [Patescibacteria group bacterium]|uniref:Undecaprenyl-diphosphatase n=1 Tax=candidate division WWE3 bacterium TaxID=2053526 RepID=A0A928TVF8_UNCKA|nr:undecaprenyl-diphosphatase UppP [candidate division WWE3 bacterium]MCL4732486.1 undecaprenyl-diphosphatase UppP [Patescibacteria group bacterium]MDL1952606.1 undecaprenyl-diphosphatase UppP [Candidatus Uhrbacteria bacterium UHB]RIL01262.1 MAG: undecaprenyl-diphosphatase UppP [Candidatus Uhrbacteria bacterium]